MSNLKSNLKIVFAVVLLLLLNANARAQGCVAIRGFTPSIPGQMYSEYDLGKGDFSLGTNFRYFESFRHFRGDEEETNRIEEGTNVINNSYFMDLIVNYGITNRLYVNLLIPFVSHVRSSMYEHGGNSLGDRHKTSSNGLSDIRFGAGYWLFEPNSKPFNFAIEANIKLPTGDYEYTDTFYNQGPDKDMTAEGVVDQSIQPGDGGVGVSLSTQGFYSLSHHFMLTTSLYYLLNPMESNGVLTRRGTSEFSVPDQYAALLGAMYLPNVKGLSLYLGGRIEGVPSSDLIGGSAGYRRPGYVISVDPGINYIAKNLTLSLNVPFAVYRNRTQSYQDKQRTEETGVYRHGDAAFADYFFNLNINYIFQKKPKKLPEVDNKVDFNKTDIEKDQN